MEIKSIKKAKTAKLREIAQSINNGFPFSCKACKIGWDFTSPQNNHNQRHYKDASSHFGEHTSCRFIFCSV